MGVLSLHSSSEKYLTCICSSGDKNQPSCWLESLSVAIKAVFPALRCENGFGEQQVGVRVTWMSGFKVELKVNGRGERGFREGRECRGWIPQ